MTTSRLYSKRSSSVIHFRFLNNSAEGVYYDLRHIDVKVLPYSTLVFKPRVHILMTLFITLYPTMPPLINFDVLSVILKSHNETYISVRQTCIFTDVSHRALTT